MLLQAALAALLSASAPATDIPIGAAIAGRTDDALDDLVGFFVNTLVLRIDTRGDPSFVELLARAREPAWRPTRIRTCPSSGSWSLLDPPRALGRQPLFQTMLVLQNNPEARLELRGVSASPLRPLAPTTKFDLTFTFREAPDGLDAELEYSAEQFDPATAERLLQRLARLLDQIAADPAVPLHRLDILSSDERRRLVGGVQPDGGSGPRPDAGPDVRAAGGRDAGARGPGV